MKKKLLILLVLFSFALTPLAQAHQGRTDSQGGHTNHSTGEYHYHHGYPAHQHEDDICPYEYDAPMELTDEPSEVKEYKLTDTAPKEDYDENAKENVEHEKSVSKKNIFENILGFYIGLFSLYGDIPSDGGLFENIIGFAFATFVISFFYYATWKIIKPVLKFIKSIIDREKE